VLTDGKRVYTQLEKKVLSLWRLILLAFTSSLPKTKNLGKDMQAPETDHSLDCALLKVVLPKKLGGFVDGIAEF
jgi:hypothetical protein